jgi:hypothetical protein
MSGVNYEGRVFRGVVNYDDGDLNRETRWQYHQRESVVWATVEGGGVAFGTLLAKVDADGSLDLRWQHVNRQGALIGGTCFSRLEVLPDGRYRLHESWRVTEGGDEVGSSVVEEVARSGE